MNGMALLLAAGSAAGFAVSSSLQHHSAGSAPESVQGARRLFAHLLGRPAWLVGQALALVSFTLHVIALNVGALLIVQPVVVSGLVLAVPVRAAIGRRWPSARELGTVSLAALGLGLFLVVARPSAGEGHPAHGLALVLTGAGVLVAALLTGWGTRLDGSRAAFAFGAAAGTLFGVLAGLVKLTAEAAAGASGPGPGPSLLAAAQSWSTSAVVVVGMSGVVLNQRAYRAGRLSASMPVLNVVDVVVALAFGTVIFGETPALGVLPLLGEVVALLLVVLALRRLSADDDLVDVPRELEMAGSAER